MENEGNPPIGIIAKTISHMGGAGFTKSVSKSGSNGLSFIKMDASGNDFILIDAAQIAGLAQGGAQKQGQPRAGQSGITSQVVQFLCNRTKGIGCDQLFAILQQHKNRITLEIYNQDGSTAANCGNGMRAIAGCFFAVEPSQNECEIEIIYNETSKIVKCKRRPEEALVEVDMGTITVEKQPALTSPAEAQEIFNIGNLHAITEVPQPKGQRPTKRPIINKKEAKMEGTPKHPQYPLLKGKQLIPSKELNKNYITIIGENKIGLTTIERGVGITQCCGSGSCASVAYGVYKNKLPSGKEVEIISKGTAQQGNNALKVIATKTNNPSQLKVALIGGYNLNFWGVMPKSSLLGAKI